MSEDERAGRLAELAVRAGARDDAPDSRLPGGGTEGETQDDHGSGLLHVMAHPVEHVVEPVVGAVVSAAEPVVGAVGAVRAASEPVAGAMGHAVGVAGRAAGRAIAGRDARLRRRLRRLNKRPLPNLYEVHPEARDATQHGIGVRFVPLDEIRGTAVAGAAQRGSDFRPLPPFQGSNWEARWKRIRRANERLETLPPIDVVRFGGCYWVLDGHNRVAAALYDNAAGLDAVVTELVPLDGRLSERPSYAPILAYADELRGGLAAARALPLIGSPPPNAAAVPAASDGADPDVAAGDAGSGEPADGAGGGAADPASTGGTPPGAALQIDPFASPGPAI